MTYQEELEQIHQKRLQDAWRKVDEWQDLQRHNSQRLREELDAALNASRSMDDGDEDNLAPSHHDGSRKNRLQ